MGRNIWQSDNPVPMIKAVRAIVHGNLNVNQAYDMYKKLCNEQSKTKKNTKPNKQKNNQNKPKQKNNQNKNKPNNPNNQNKSKNQNKPKQKNNQNKNKPNKQKK